LTEGFRTGVQLPPSPPDLVLTTSRWCFLRLAQALYLGIWHSVSPILAYDQWLLGMPSIWAWQIIWWSLGVGVVWFLANKLRMSVEPEIEIKAISED